MLVIPPASVRSRRLRWPEPQPVPPAPLQVIGVEHVVYNDGLLFFTLVIDTTESVPLVGGDLDAANWTGEYAGGAFTSFAASVAAFDRVDVILEAVGALEPYKVSYAANPTDVRDGSGRVLAAFTNFSL